MGLELLKIIGNGDAFGSGGRYHTCFYLESSDSKLLVDLGATSVHKLISEIDLNQIDMVIISHFHGDHFGGIPFLLLNNTFVSGREKPLKIIGPKGCRERVLNLTENLYQGIYENLNRINLEFLEYETGVALQVKDLKILATPAIHSEGSSPHSIQIYSGTTKFSYSGDTQWTDDLYEVGENADIFICECTNYSSNIEGHLNYLHDENKLLKIRAKKIMLTHMGPEMLDQKNKDKVKFDYTEESKIYKF